MPNKSAIGSDFEMSLRTLLLLETVYDTALDSIQIGAIDFIAVYAADFDILEENLHGYGAYRFSEYPARKDLVSAALKDLALSGLIDVVTDSSGLQFRINQNGLEISEQLSSPYAEDYQAAVDAVINHYGSADSKMMVRDIRRVTSKSLEINIPRLAAEQEVIEMCAHTISNKDKNLPIEKKLLTDESRKEPDDE